MRRSLALVVALTACGDPVNDTPDAGTAVRAWSVVQGDLPEAVMSIWGTRSDDVWIVGADVGTGPLAMHFDGTSWSRIDTGVRGDLWWVSSPDADAVWFAGEHGLLLRYDRATKAVTQTSSVTTATLFGLWGPRGGPIHAVGGDIFGGGDKGVVVRHAAGTSTTVGDLPTDLDPAEVLFKIWGTAANDILVVGDRGSILRYDGAAWSRRVQPDRPRLVTVHGRSADDMVIVGGVAQAVLLESKDGAPWVDISPRGRPALSGVFVAPDGVAVAVGNSGGVLERRRGFWEDVPDIPLMRDWHSVWIDEKGDYWIAGGHFRSATMLVGGAVLRLSDEGG